MNRKQLDPNNLPPAFSSLIPCAERWGIGDDIEREMAIENATAGDLNTLAHCLDDIDDQQLVEWLNGSESGRKPLTPEYIAITSLTMAVQSAKSELRRRPAS